MANTAQAGEHQSGVLGLIERVGNRLPDPVFIFFWLIAGLMVLSAVLAALGVSVAHPTQVDAEGAPVAITAQSLFSAQNLARLVTDMPATFTGFHPLGYVIVVMLGAGVAERSGLFATAMRASVRHAPTALLTPVVALVAILSNMAADAAYVVLIPLAGVLYAAAGRHPIAGIAAAFAGVSGGFSANLAPGQLDALLFGITEAAAETLDPSWDANIAGNWYFMAALTLIYLPIIWYVTDRVVEPRLGAWSPAEGDADADAGGGGDEDAMSAAQKRGLAYAGVAALVVLAAWLALVFGPGTPLINEDAPPQARLSPLYSSLVAAFFILFLACGWAYGAGAGTIRSHRDVVQMMSEAMGQLGYYLVLAFAAAHFVAMFAWSNLGLIIAVSGAEAIQTSGLPIAVTLALLVLFSGVANLFIGSASAKWALLAPIMTPMFMLLGVSPEMATAAYRVGDSPTNIITPLMPYFPLVLVFAQRWTKSFGIGSLTAIMVPFALWMLVSGLAMTALWAVFELPLGPGAPMAFELAPTAAP